MKKILTSLLFVAATTVFGFDYPSQTSYVVTNVGKIEDYQKSLFNYDQHIKILREPQEKLYGMYVGYYAMSAWTYSSGIPAYMGLQQDYMGKKVVFSSWDPPAETGLTVKTNHPNCKRFGHEGTGVMCTPKFEWKAGVEYSLSVTKISETNYGDKYQAKLINISSQEEYVIGEIEMPTYNPGLQYGGPAYVGYGGISPAGITNTIEYYYGPQNMTCSTLPYMGVEWKGPYGDNNTRFPNGSIGYPNTPVGENCENNVRATSTNEPYTFIQEASGNLITNMQQNNWVITPEQTIGFNEIDCILNRAEFLYSNLFDQKKFKHIQISKTVGNLYGRDYRDRGTNNGTQLYVDMRTNTLQYVVDNNSWTVAVINDRTKTLHGCYMH
jgi:hypothetical protein